MNKPSEKGRSWAGLIYPGDSCPENWEDLMKKSGLRILVSPLHDRDKTDDGKLKKPHRHVIAMWDNPTTRRNAENFFAQFKGPGVILRLENPRGMARYLIHLDDPDKVLYEPADVLEFNGADWKKIALPEDDTSDAMGIVNLVDEMKIHGYFELLRTCEFERPDLLDFAIRRTSYCKEVIWSYWHIVAGRYKPEQDKQKTAEAKDAESEDEMFEDEKSQEESQPPAEGSE